MKPLSAVLLFFCAVSSQCPTWAAVIQRDWKTPGDGLLTFDTVDKREWLDLSQTILSSQFPGADREARYQYVAGQTGTGGLFEGFSMAKSPDVIALGESAGIDTTTQDYARNFAPTIALGQLLSFTLQPANGNKLAVGVLDEMGPSGQIRGTAIFWTVFTNQAGLVFQTPHTEFTTPPGVMLFRVAVPEPTALQMIILSLCAMAARRRVTST